MCEHEQAKEDLETLLRALEGLQGDKDFYNLTGTIPVCGRLIQIMNTVGEIRAREWLGKPRPKRG